MLMLFSNLDNVSRFWSTRWVSKASIFQFDPTQPAFRSYPWSKQQTQQWLFPGRD
jgi:streptogramin lyase